MKRWISVDIRNVYKSGGTGNYHHTIMTKDELINLVENRAAITENIKRLGGVNGALVEKDEDGRYWVYQLGGYNGNIGMFCYLVEPDNTLQRAV